MVKTREKPPREKGIPIVPSPITSANVIGFGEKVVLVYQNGAFHVVAPPRGDA